MDLIMQTRELNNMSLSQMGVEERICGILIHPDNNFPAEILKTLYVLSPFYIL